MNFEHTLSKLHIYAQKNEELANSTVVPVSYTHLVKYEQFECKTCGEKVKAGHKNYVGHTTVSYTHLDVYKRQGKHCIIFQRLFLEYIINAQQSG